MIKNKIYWHQSKESNWNTIDKIEEDHPNFFNDDEAKNNFIYTGYEVECDVEIHPDGRVFATHFMGVELKERVEI